MTGARLPLTVLTSMSAVLRDSACADVLCDVADAVVLRYDLDRESTDGLRRTVIRGTGVVQDVLVPLDHECLGCALREDVLPVLAAMAEDPTAPPTRRVVLALPVTAEPVSTLHALAGGIVKGAAVSHLVRVEGVVSVLDASTITADLFGHRQLAEEGLGLSYEDDRPVAEALAHQLDEADAVLLNGDVDDAGDAVLRHLCVSQVDRLQLHLDSGASTVRRRRRTGRSSTVRSDPRRVRHGGAPDRCGVWTRTLTSTRPFHPDRLFDRLERLGGGVLRGRGAFWLPSRPDTVCAWDSAGGQLSIGDVGAWGQAERRTTLVVTGHRQACPHELSQAFAEALATAAESATIATEDGFEPWLGPTTS